MMMFINLTYIKTYIKTVGMRNEYTLFKRYKDTKNKKYPVWFFYYYDESGKRKAKSTGKSTKYEAQEIAEKFLYENTSGTRTLEDYTRTFFVWDECLWIKRQLAKGRRFSKGIAKLRRSSLTQYILPKFGKRTLESLNRVEIENWLVSLKSITTGEPLSNQTKNHILYAFRIVLREAEREGLVPYNCLSIVESLAVQPRARDIFSKKELQKLFPEDREALIDIWRTEEYAYYFFILATTGLRRGEGRGLQWRHIIWNEERNGLYIEQAVKDDDSLGTTKTGKSRVVLLNKRAETYLNKWLQETPYNGMSDFIFFGKDGTRPIMGKTLQNRFKNALEKAGIVVGERNLVIHSFRHTYNTMLRPLLPVDILQTTTGHSSLNMTERYNHPSIEDSYKRVLAFENVFDELF